MKTKNQIDAIILAAGKGTRMKSDLLKVAHHVAGKPVVNYVVDTVQDIGVSTIYMVIGHQAESIKELLPSKNIEFVLQKEQLGTGHAVMQVGNIYPASESTVLILAGDCPLIKPETLHSLINMHVESNSAATVLTTNMKDPALYGRILRGEMGTVLGIKEAKDCNKDELKITEINTGVYAFKSSFLFENLKKLNTNNKQGEYYLTDILHILKKSGDPVSAYCVDDEKQAIGINTRLDLAKSNKVIYQRNNLHFMTEGVTILDPDSTFIDSTVSIGKDTIINPFTVIKGNSKIGSHCTVGSHCYLENVTIENNTTVTPHTH
jgi:bifunctional UDP-N-acetylglucosamine pyrophosphorylase / glucosamine-1-phosphate N-acetyltransferase